MVLAVPAGVFVEWSAIAGGGLIEQVVSSVIRRPHHG